MKVAIFDVDRTLVDGMCGYFYYLALRPHISLARRLRVSLEILGHRWGFSDESRVVELGALMCAGLNVGFLKEVGQNCFEKMIKGRLLVEGLSRIREHKEQGHKVILASGSNEFAVAPVAEFVGADRYYATGAVSENGILTQELRYPLVFKEGKLEILRKGLDELGVGWSDCYIYSDNLSDLMIFERCGYPVVVNPKEQLEKIAMERSWPVERWNTLYDSGRSATGSSFPLR